MKLSGLLLCLGLLVAAPAAAAQAPAARADALLEAFTADRPGVSVAVMKGGELVYARQVGAADIEQDRPVTARTRFHVASISKQFTAFALALLAHEGKLGLDDDIRDHLPWMPDFGATIRVSDLIHHTSGLRDQWDLFWLSGTDMQSLLRQNAILAMARNQRGLNFAPGTEFRYSNTGYSLAAEIVAKASGMPFRQFVEERIFRPVGMNDTIVYDNAAELVPGRAQSYRLEFGIPRIARFNYDNYGATGVQSTAADLLKWAGELMDPKVFDPALVRSLAQPGRLRDGTAVAYGFGLYEARLAGKRAVMHGGADAGYRAAFATFPEEDAAIVVLVNAPADAARMADRLAEIFLSGDQPEEVQPDPALLPRLAGHYVNEWGIGMDLRAEEGRLVRVRGRERQTAVFRADGSFDFGSPASGLRRLPDGTLEEQALGGRTIVHRPAARAEPALAELRALAGYYRSDELDVTWSLSVEDGKLVLASLRADPVTLVPSVRDRFEGPMLRLDIVRDAAGRATGFDVATAGGRVRELRFHRVPRS